MASNEICDLAAGVINYEGKSKGRRIYYRLVGYNAQLQHMFNFSHMLRTFSFQ